MAVFCECCFCRYGDSYKWTTDGSCMLKHHLVIDTTGSDVDQQVQQVVGFVQSLQAATDRCAAAAASKAAAFAQRGPDQKAFKAMENC